MATSLARLKKPITMHLDSLYYELRYFPFSPQLDSTDRGWSHSQIRLPRHVQQLLYLPGPEEDGSYLCEVAIRAGGGSTSSFFLPFTLPSTHSSCPLPQDLKNPPHLSALRLTPGSPTATLAGFPLTYLRDLSIGYDSSSPLGPSHPLVPSLPSDPTAHMLSFRLGSTSLDAEQKDGIQVEGTVRTSGTEPKIKFYLEARGPNGAEGRTRTREKLERVREAVGKEWLKAEEEGLERP